MGREGGVENHRGRAEKQTFWEEGQKYTRHPGTLFSFDTLAMGTDS